MMKLGRDVRMYDYGEADRGRCKPEESDRVGEFLRQTDAGCLMQAVTTKQIMLGCGV